MALKNRLLRWRRELAALGVWHWLGLMLQRNRGNLFSNVKVLRAGSPHAQFPLFYRKQASDWEVFEQIFIGREYRCLDDVKNAAFIIDCGGNVGYASAYFLSRYPQAQLTVVEPDSANFAILQRNLAPYAPRVTALRAGVWSHTTGLKISEEKFGDGREWAVTVRATRPGEIADMQAIDIGQLLRDSPHKRIDILKIDIEGSEAEVFAENYQDWLPLVNNLVIELHGERCTEIFEKAIANAGFAVSTCDELTVCRRVLPAASAEA